MICGNWFPLLRSLTLPPLRRTTSVSFTILILHVFGLEVHETVINIYILYTCIYIWQMYGQILNRKTNLERFLTTVHTCISSWKVCVPVVHEMLFFFIFQSMRNNLWQTYWIKDQNLVKQDVARYVVLRIPPLVHL